MYSDGENSGVWKYNGTKWISLNTDQQLARLGVSSIAVDPVLNTSNINNIYAATSGSNGSDGIYRSVDNGITWVAINSGLFNSSSGNNNTIGKILVDPTNSTDMYAATSVGIFKCSNRQVSTPTWINIYSGTSSATAFTYNILFDPFYNGTTNKILYASGVDIIKITNGGGSWTSIALPTSGIA